MNPQIIDHILSSYGLINGKTADVAAEFTVHKLTPSTEFKIIKETLDFKEMAEFLSELHEYPTLHALFQHTPGWTIMLSNSSQLNSFATYQTEISSQLQRKTISVIDTKSVMNIATNEKQNQAHVFHMLDEQANIMRSIRCENKNGEWEFNDQGKEFQQYTFNTKAKQPIFSDTDLTELIKAATQYDLTLNEIFERKFILLEEK